MSTKRTLSNSIWSKDKALSFINAGGEVLNYKALILEFKF